MESDDFAVLRTQSKQFLNNNKKKNLKKNLHTYSWTHFSYKINCSLRLQPYSIK